SRTLRIAVTIGSETDGAGDIENGTSFQCPQGFTNTGSNTVQLTQIGWSAICYNEERGFFGIAYGVGSRNDPFAGGGAGGYYGASLCFFIQRTQTNLGIPTLDGYMIYYPNLPNLSNNVWSSNTHPLSL